MPHAPANGIELYYETHGDRADPALLLVNGYSSQILGWFAGFRERLAEQGRFVVSFDNRDVGLSTHLDGVEVDLRAVTKAAAAGEPLPPVPYTLSTFADDAVGLLDYLDIDAAHIAGVSMGGMIVQQMAIDHSDRVLTMTSIMSTTGEPEYFESSPEAGAALMAPWPTDRDEFIAAGVASRKIGSSRRYFDADLAAELLAASYDRMFYPEGLSRQMSAVRGSPPRAAGLRQLRVPTLVIHGRDDELILPKGGERTAELVPSANLLFLGDMGHDLPKPLWPLIIDAIISHTAHASPRP
ncbi:alpha/beta fold hydrolase [Candidatus Poriferisodalis sp.]|uniref:alpha/beta fold hydrolase n=1 Tax=Candidatus Poriferisodalis sp. TaxID=3101277 RepID=UPI003D1520F8